MPSMRVARRTVGYVAWSVFVAWGYFAFTYYYIYLEFGHEHLLAATMVNLATIFFWLLAGKLEAAYGTRLYVWSKRNGSPTTLTRVIRWWMSSASIKTSLYLFYIVVLFCAAILAADPGFPRLSEHADYLITVRYGLLVLVAGDKFFEQIAKDIRDNQQFLT
ncbi:hypothetical protein [Nocardioides sp. CER19]|uniref:hypothetical protein n=1 Tax=Nocardioides sp. CER19 TaxID=3038538 RepID=UPI00244B5F22|nr:hypothetical protein [Nocardioides sp. CER19]MDH2413809.1 hypothetical protein [Nocardioides sp. CER19]